MVSQTPIRRLEMPTDPAWRFAESHRLMERTEELSRAAREQVIQSRRIIAESRRIMATIRPDVFGAAMPPRLDC
jgi:hypothetical protein